MKKTDFHKGMDISGLPRYLDEGMQIRDLDGSLIEPFAFLKKYDVNSIRLRIWVNPENEPYSKGYCNLEHTLRMAKQVKENGMKFMLDFHYSDWWADPGKQKKPLAWEGLSRDALEEKLYEYTREVLLALDAQGTLPDIVQIGNEIRSGLVFPEGELPDYRGMVRLINAGIRAARSVADKDTMQVMIHLDQGGRYQWLHKWFEGAFAEGLEDFDLIGLSYYPFWHGTYLDLKAAMKQLLADYQKPIMIVETAYAWRRSERGFIDDEQLRIGGLPASPLSQRQNLELIMYLLAELPDNMGCGIYYWEPLCIPNPEHGGWDENMGILDETGKAMEAILAYDSTEEKRRKEPEFWPELKSKILREEMMSDEMDLGINLLPNGDFARLGDLWNMRASDEDVAWHFCEAEPNLGFKIFAVESQRNFTFRMDTVLEGCEPGDYILTVSAKGVDTTGVDVRLFACTSSAHKETVIHPIEKWTTYRVDFTVKEGEEINLGIAIQSPPISLSTKHFRLTKKHEET